MNCTHLRRRVGCAVALWSVAFAWNLHAQRLTTSVDAQGHYSIASSTSGRSALSAGVAAKIGGAWVRSDDYPHHSINKSAVQGYLGAAEQWQVTFSGLAGKPDLVYILRAYQSEPFADLQVIVRNRTANPIDVQSIRSVDATSGAIASLDGPASEDRVLSDSFSEDRPAMRIHDLPDAKDGMHRAVGSQLIYNQKSRQSLFLGALSSDRFLTILRLHSEGNRDAAHIVRYEVDSTGTTEMELENSLEKSPDVDRVELSMPVPPGGELASETLALSVGTDYHHQLETYGSLIRQIHHPRISAPPLMGWWSWTAFYFGLNEGAALTNAQWEAEHLKQFGYTLFHIDEGYQYARGEYTTPNALVFPHGLTNLEYKIRGLGLIPGIWTAPFEVSERSWVYTNHPDWLVKNAQGHPIHAGFVEEGKDQLYVLDTTNPAAQRYLRETYTKLVKEWGIHYIKMDFMDDSAIEGYYYKPHTTAMEAQRIGLDIIRKTVGDDVFLDKDGSVMLNPVGYVDFGRISQDTGHSFEASSEAVTGIAARYYMNRNYFVADPDAFSISTQRITDQTWHEGKQPLTLDEAKVAVALAAVTGGMFEVGDDLPTLERSPDRLSLASNPDILDMVHLSRASVPVDLMSYSQADQLPGVFYLKQSSRQSILTVFNWAAESRTKNLALSELGIDPAGQYAISDVFDHTNVNLSSGSLSLTLPPHSVKMLKIIDQKVPVAPLALALDCPGPATAGDSLAFTAHSEGGNPALVYEWDFADGTHLEGSHGTHAWTEPGDYEVHVSASGLDHTHTDQRCKVHITGHVPTRFEPAKNIRYRP